MVKFFKIVSLAMLVVAVMAGGAMAGTMANTSRVIDYKMMSSDSWLVDAATLAPITGAGVVMGYTVGTSITKGNTFRLVLTNASWGQSGTIYLGGATTSNVANCTPIVGQKTCLMTVQGTNNGQVGMHAGATYYTNLTGVNGVAASPPALLVKSGFLATDTVTYGIDTNAVAGTNSEDTLGATATNILTAASGTTLTLTGTEDAATGARVIDTTNSRFTFVTGVGTTRGAKTTLAWTNTGNTPSTLIGTKPSRVGFKTTLSITGDFTGVSGLSWGTNASTSACYTSTSCTATLVNQLGSLTGDSAPLVFTVTGSTALTPRTFTISAVSTNQEERTDPMNLSPATAGAMTHTWTSNGYNAIIPGLIYDALGTYATSCTINNPTASATDVDVDILNAYTGSSAVQTKTAVVSVPSKGTARLVFNLAGASTITPYLYSGGVETAQTAVTLTGLSSANDRYSAKITLTGAAVTDATIACVQGSPQGNRAIPVLIPQSGEAARQ